MTDIGPAVTTSTDVITDVTVPVTASGFTGTTPDGTSVHDVVHQTPVQHPILRHFEFGHLPEHLAAVSQEFHRLAHVMHNTLPDGAEKSAGLRKLLEAKDCMVRAARP